MSISVSLELTKNCNFRCRHCAINAGPGGKIMSITNVKEVLNHLPGNLEYLLLSGGEIFTIKDRLWQTLEYIRDHRQRLFPKVKISVNTNGFWIKDAPSDVETFRRLHEYGVNNIGFSGMDAFHKEQGLNLEMVKRGALNARAILERDLGGNETFTFMFYGCRPGIANPLGRAASLPANLLRPESKCSLPLDSAITVGSDGEAYLCCWQGSPSIGSVITTPLDELVNRASVDPVLGALMREGLLAAAIALGVYDPGKAGEYTTRACIICKGLFAGYSGLRLVSNSFR